MTKTMTTEEIAKKLCEHCRNHTEAQGLKELYAEDAESIEGAAGTYDPADLEAFGYAGREPGQGAPGPTGD